MFVLREIAVSLSFFAFFYCCLSLIVVATWRGLKRLRFTEKNLAETLFVARLLPTLASVAVTFMFVIPSFQLLEPRGIEEGTGILPIALGGTAIVFLTFGCYRVFKAQSRTAKIVAEWLERSKREGAYTVCPRSDVPPLTLVGLRHPRVLVSDLTLALLTENEMRIALRHERAHISSRDNFKKLISQFCPFPGMGQLESAWTEAAEMAADDDAVSDANDAVDLAAALVKLSRLAPIRSAPICTVGFVSGSVGHRVTRLLAWNKTERQSLRIPAWAVASMFFSAATILFFTYGAALVITHEMTELLVR